MHSTPNAQRPTLRTCALARLLVVMALLVAPSASAIVGGFDPPPDEYRYDAVAAFGKTNRLVGPVQYNNSFGSATLINCEWAITARHNLSWNTALLGAHQYDDHDFYENLPPPGYFSLRFRRHENGTVGAVTTIPPDLGALSFHHVEAVEFILTSEQYSGPNDLCLIRLAEPVTHIQSIAVRFEADGSFPVGSSLVLAGWGKEHVSGPCPGPGFEPSERLKVANTVFATPLSAGYWFWPNACVAACGCGSWLQDSGGAVVLERACGTMELIGVINQIDRGVNIWNHAAIPTFPIANYQNQCPADLNCDGVVDGGDLGVLLLNWGSPGCGGLLACEPDLDGDGDVDGADLGLLLLAWGPCAGSCEGSEDGSASAPASAQSAADDVDQFHAWLLQATMEDLMEWLYDAFLPQLNESGG